MCTNGSELNRTETETDVIHVYAFAINSMVHVGVPSSWALPGYPIPVHHLCAFLLYLAR